MKTQMLFVLPVLLISLLLSSCGPSQAEVDATMTQAAANIFATQTAQAPTITPTATATATPTDTPTPTLTPTPTPGLYQVVPTLDDLPAGFALMPADQLSAMAQSFPDATAFGFNDNQAAQIVMGIFIPVQGGAQQTTTDKALPDLIQGFAAGVGATKSPQKLADLDEIGESRAGITSVGPIGALSERYDVLGFRRGDVVVLLIVAYPDGDQPAKSLADLARLLDERISMFQAANP